MVSFDDPPLPCDDRGSSPLAPRRSRSISLDFSLSRSFSFSFSSLTASVDFFLTNPAASSAVVARCMMLTLPARGLRLPFEPPELGSRSLRLPLGVDGCERPESPVIVDVEGDSKGERGVGDTLRGGVDGLGIVGVGGTSANLGCKGAFTTCSCDGEGGVVCVATEVLCRFFFPEDVLSFVDSASFGSGVSKEDSSASPTGDATSAALSFSKNIFSSFSFFRSIHHNDPAASHAFVSTECTICAVSKPSKARVFNRCRSVVVENIIGVRALRRPAKSRSRADGIGKGVGVLSFVGEALSDNMEDTERRLVRAGVRTGCDGGGLELDHMRGEGEYRMCSSSTTVAGCVFASREERDSRSEVECLRMVELLGKRWIEVSCFISLSVLSNGSLMDSSGVVGVEEPSSD